ncbi:MAG: ABC transporter substrate-binding protein [Gemmatimonadota bacterium]|nr:ABC transporter substrate-binding protein [Gemmatimonadota bacterium]
MLALGVVAIVAAACGRRQRPPTAAQLDGMPWDSVVARAHATTVTWLMWRGDPSVNAYVDSWVAPRLKYEYNITLRTVDAEGPAILNALVVEREAGHTPGSADLLWINGETFANLRQEGLLFGPWAGRLPNAAYVDSASPIVARDFEQRPNGYESPWGRVQFALIYDMARTPHPPRTVAELRQWILAHPGRFTYDQSFTGMTFLKTLMYALEGGVAPFEGGFHEAVYDSASARLFSWLRAVGPALWHDGRDYPRDVAALQRMFANDEVDFAMSDNQNDVVTKVRQGILPATARPLLLRDGTIANAHYVGIAFNAPNPAGAMVVANVLLSPAAQLEKQEPAVWDDGTVLAIGKLPAEWRARFEALGRDPHALSPDSLAKYARPEVNPRYQERLEADWRRLVRDAQP